MIFLRDKTDIRKPLLADELGETQRWDDLGLLVTYVINGRLSQCGLWGVSARGVMVIVEDMKGRISLETSIPTEREMGEGTTKEVGMRGTVSKVDRAFWGYLLLGQALYILYMPYFIQLPQ